MSLVCARCDRTAHGSPDALPEGWENHASTLTNATFLVCPDCARKSTPAARATGDSAADRLRLLIERVERLEEEKRGISDDIKDVYAEAKATGYDAKVMREIVKRRRMDGHSLREFESLLETYQDALGMGVDGAGREDPEQRFANCEAAEPEPDYTEAALLVREHGKASTSWLQRQLAIGYNSAARLIERMEREGVVSAPDHTGRRTVLAQETVQ